MAEQTTAVMSPQKTRDSCSSHCLFPKNYFSRYIFPGSPRPHSLQFSSVGHLRTSSCSVTFDNEQTLHRSCLIFLTPFAKCLKSSKGRDHAWIWYVHVCVYWGGGYFVHSLWNVVRITTLKNQLLDWVRVP